MGQMPEVRVLGTRFPCILETSCSVVDCGIFQFDVGGFAYLDVGRVSLNEL